MPRGTRGHRERTHRGRDDHHVENPPPIACDLLLVAGVKSTGEGPALSLQPLVCTVLGFLEEEHPAPRVPTSHALTKLR